MASLFDFLLHDKKQFLDMMAIYHLVLISDGSGM
jgi:hypothetical protein